MNYINLSNIAPAIIVAFTAIVAPSCSCENLGNIDTMQRNYDNDPTRTAEDIFLSDSIMIIPDTADSRQPSTEDAIKIAITDFDDQDWELLKQSLTLEEASVADDSLRDIGADVVYGPWETTENNRYQLAYYYAGEGDLWLRLRVEENNSAGVEEDIRYLTQQEAENRRMSAAWVEMVTTARQLEDSLNNRNRQNIDNQLKRNQPQ
nr:hypothetical protein [Cytophagales bacterium]